jgi:hypothetical protein
LNTFNFIIVSNTIFYEIIEDIYTVNLIVNLVLIKGMLIYAQVLGSLTFFR